MASPEEIKPRESLFSAASTSSDPAALSAQQQIDADAGRHRADNTSSEHQKQLFPEFHVHTVARMILPSWLQPTRAY